MAAAKIFLDHVVPSLPHRELWPGSGGILPANGAPAGLTNKSNRIDHPFSNTQLPQATMDVNFFLSAELPIRAYTCWP